MASNIHSFISLVLYLASEASKSAIILAMTDSHFVKLYIIYIYVIVIIKY
nr:MAG TPA: hypothetical protein [Caudoviricetes sp.]